MYSTNTVKHFKMYKKKQGIDYFVPPALSNYLKTNAKNIKTNHLHMFTKQFHTIRILLSINIFSVNVNP